MPCVGAPAARPQILNSPAQGSILSPADADSFNRDWSPRRGLYRGYDSIADGKKTDPGSPACLEMATWIPSPAWATNTALVVGHLYHLVSVSRLIGGQVRGVIARAADRILSSHGETLLMQSGAPRAHAMPAVSSEDALTPLTV